MMKIIITEIQDNEPIQISRMQIINLESKSLKRKKSSNPSFLRMLLCFIPLVLKLKPLKTMERKPKPLHYNQAMFKMRNNDGTFYNLFLQMDSFTFACINLGYIGHLNKNSFPSPENIVEDSVRECYIFLYSNITPLSKHSKQLLTQGRQPVNILKCNSETNSQIQVSLSSAQ